MSNIALAADLIARDKASVVLDRVGGKAEGTGKKFGGLSRAAVVGGAAAGAALLKFGKDSAGAFMEAEQQSAQLDLAMRKFPKTADVTRDSYDKLNSAIQLKTGLDDDALAAGEAVLAQFNLTGKQIQGLTPLLADYAVKTGKDLPDAAVDLGRAFLGNTRALKTLGINYKSTGDAAKDQAAIQALLQQKIGGTAEAMGNTAAGKVAILKTRFENIQETVGQKLVPALTKAADVGLRVIDFVDRNSAVIVPLLGVVGTLIVGIKLWTMAQAALNVVMALNPIGLVVLAIVALAAGIVLAWKRSERFREVVRATMGAARSAIGWVIDKGQALVGFFTKLPGRISSATKGMWDGIKDAFRSAINWLIDKWNGLELRIPEVDTHIPGIGKVGGFGLGTPDIPRLAEGGIVKARPGGIIANVGEGGEDEIVAPLSKLGGGGLGGEVHMHFHGPVASKEQLADWVETALARKQGRGVKLKFS